MTLIREEDLVESIADAFQYISYLSIPKPQGSPEFQKQSVWDQRLCENMKNTIAFSLFWGGSPLPEGDLFQKLAGHFSFHSKGRWCI